MQTKSKTNGDNLNGSQKIHSIDLIYDFFCFFKGSLFHEVFSRAESGRRIIFAFEFLSCVFFMCLVSLSVLLQFASV